MPVLKDEVDNERGRLFVGRRAELRHLEAWLADAAAPTHVVLLWGMGGIGKSALAAEMLRTARANGALALWVDGRACGRSPAGFLEYVNMLVDRAEGPQPPAAGAPAVLARLAAAMAEGQRLVLAVDNYDAIAHLEGWLREEFLARLPARGALAALAGRPGPSHAWSADPAWRRRVISMPLGPFSREESEEYLARLGLAGSAAAGALLRAAAGHPLALAVGADRMFRHPGAGAADVAHDISAHLLHEVTAPEALPWLEALAVLPEADEELLSHMWAEPIPPNGFRSLAGLSFVATAGSSLSLHDVARTHLLADLRRRAPGRWRELRRRALLALRARLAAAPDRPHRRRVAASLVSLCRDALPVHPHADLTEAGSSTPYQPADLPHLHGQLDDWSRRALGFAEVDDEHRLLDRLSDQFPESIRVIRGPGGDPVGFMAVVLLHRETVALLEQHRLAGLYLRRCAPAERAALDCSPAAADSYWAPLIGGTSCAPMSPGATAALGSLLRDCVALLGEGARFLTVNNDPGISALMQRIGYRPLPAFRDHFAGSPSPFLAYELDLRGVNFADWVVSYLGAMDRDDAAPAAAPPPLDEVRAALTVLAFPSRLHTTALARRLGASGRELQSRLEALLTGNPSPRPLTRRDQEVLQAAFGLVDETPEDAAARLHLSRATYYRKLREALAALAEALGAL